VHLICIANATMQRDVRGL